MISSALNIGRQRGEFERATAQMRSVRGGHRHPATAGVGEIGALADAYRQAADVFCAQRKEGRLARGVPDALWLAGCAPDAGHPAGYTGRELPAEKLWIFLPEQKDATLRGVHVTTTHKGTLLAWCEPELMAYLGDGYRVSIRYDATEPSLGCALFNRETGARNRDGWPVGEFMGIAEYAPACPQITSGLGNLTLDEERAAGHRKRYEAAVRTEFRAVASWVKRGRAQVSEARDGRGRVARVERDAPAVATEAAGTRNVEPPVPAVERKPARPAAARIRTRWNSLVEA